MTPIISFIGWHDSGKTTLASQVVRLLKERGYRIGVIKSTKETGLLPDQEDTDTWKYHQAGADGICLAAPDQLIVRLPSRNKPTLIPLACRYFGNMDLVVAEGFKEEPQVAKIEVHRGQAPLLRDQVEGVVAMATDANIPDKHVFRLDDAKGIADFIEERFIQTDATEDLRCSLLVDGQPVAVNPYARKLIEETILGLINEADSPGQTLEFQLIKPGGRQK